MIVMSALMIRSAKLILLTVLAKKKKKKKKTIWNFTSNILSAT